MCTMVKSWYRSRRVRIGGAVLLFVLTAAAVVPFVVSADRFRPMLVQFVETYTGRKVQIDALRLYLLPTVHLKALNIHVRNPEGLPAGDAMVVQSVDLGISPRALLSRSLVVTHVAITGVRLKLLRDLAGRTNYDFALPPPGASGVMAEPGGGATYFLSLGHISAVTIRNVEVVFSSYDQRRRQATPSFTLSGLNAKIPKIRPDAPDWMTSLELTADLRGVKFSTPVLARPVQIHRGAFAITGGTGRGTFAAALEGMRADGVVAVAGLAPLAITFTVTIPHLDLAGLGTLIARGWEKGVDVQTAPRQRRLLARGDVKVGRILAAPLAADSVHGRLSVYTDTVRVDSYTLSFYRGTVQGAAALNHTGSALRAGVTAKARRIDLAELMRAAAPHARKVTGALEADLRITTALGRDAKAALAGAGTFAVRNGTFEGLDFKSNLAKLARILQPDVPGGTTSFTYFGGNVRIAQQRVYSDSLRFSAEGVEATAGGSFGFDRTLNYAGTGVLKTLTKETSPPEGASRSVGQMFSDVVRGAAVATGYRVPFFVRGTFDNPWFSPSATPQPVREPSPPRPQPQPQQFERRVPRN